MSDDAGPRRRMPAGLPYRADDPGLVSPQRTARRRARWEAARPIAIGDNAWLGGGVIVLPGVSVRAGAVVGAAAVTRDVPAGHLAVGNRARIVRRL